MAKGINHHSSNKKDTEIWESYDFKGEQPQGMGCWVVWEFCVLEFTIMQKFVNCIPNKECFLEG